MGTRYDLLLGNDRQYSNTPWTYYQYIYQLPLLDNQTTTNYERYVNQKAWDMTKTLDKILSNVTAYKAQMSRLQVFMQDLPAIPLWYNGMWAMFNEYWTNWPADGSRKGVHAGVLAELLPDDEHRHAHASAAGSLGLRVEGWATGERSASLPVSIGRMPSVFGRERYRR